MWRRISSGISGAGAFRPRRKRHGARRRLGGCVDPPDCQSERRRRRVMPEIGGDERRPAPRRRAHEQCCRWPAEPHARSSGRRRNFQRGVFGGVNGSEVNRRDAEPRRNPLPWCAAGDAERKEAGIEIDEPGNDIRLTRAGRDTRIGSSLRAHGQTETGWRAAVLRRWRRRSAAPPSAAGCPVSCRISSKCAGKHTVFRS